MTEANAVRPEGRVLAELTAEARPAGGYRVIYADPPWRFANYSAKGEAKNPSAQYACMDAAPIARMPVWLLAADDAALFLWATFPMLPEALEVMAGWGFAYKSGAAWAKQSSTGAKWAFGTGYLFRSAAELLLVGTRGKPRCAAHDVRNVIVTDDAVVELASFAAPVREHSRKPDLVYALIERMFPAGPRIELFARSARPGWDAWGNQAGTWQA